MTGGNAASAAVIAAPEGRLTKGEKSRAKSFLVAGVTAEQVIARLGIG